MLYTAFILGFLGSLHCLGMCGPIAFMLPLNRQNQVTQFFQLMSYHLGRLTTYTLIGVFFGLLGRGFELFTFQQHLSIFTGVLMISIIIFPKLFAKLPFSKAIHQFLIKIKSELGKELQQKKKNTFFLIGFLNGFLPCGLLYMAILGAIATHNIFYGSLYMLLFGLGTIPLMSSIVYLGKFTHFTFYNYFRKIVPIAVIIIGVLFILRGLALDIPYISPANSISNLAEHQTVCK
ncbi:sulfite exporter TauE/SafE family protein [Tenacibaculum agarivorans]|uniref:sulfite exporter TauE/SafE family protein n=1 Tax=Tenacibaculum agarivorans TaxID=1908389 RepID=UPI00094B87D2|nr:sulfite exporter TauE/SafE family protein [Tenacibaculum agarivorans]